MKKKNLFVKLCCAIHKLLEQLETACQGKSPNPKRPYLLMMIMTRGESNESGNEPAATLKALSAPTELGGVSSPRN